MKSLASLVVLAALAVPAAAQVADSVKIPPKAGDTSELKKKYAHAAPAPAAPRPAAAQDGRPMLYMHQLRGTDGFTLEQLIMNLDWSQANIGALIDYLIGDLRKGKRPAEGEDLAWARAQLAEERDFVASLIADGELSLARGVPRAPKEPAGNLVGGRVGPILYHVTRPCWARPGATDEQKLQQLTCVQANVAGHLASLLKYKQLNPPAAEEEAKVEVWLESARADLAAERGR